ncbi:MAG TPA: hypothetical protein PLY87_31335 [Planctomycetaceae bacterium]|nr:hypothetical protein [Planctomycetaceae bacterium]HQZ69635.1 hypothetical protein [Planctomycetaceae bacterium]
MTTLDEIENAVSTLPKQQKYELFQFLARQLDADATQNLERTSHSVLDIAPIRLGSLLESIDQDDDVLGQMLESEE